MYFRQTKIHFMSLRNFLLLFLAMVTSSMSAQIGAKVQQKNNIYDIWQNNQYGYQMTLILNQDGSGEFDGEVLKFTSQGNKLTILAGGEPVIYTYSLQGNSLLLSGGDLNEALTFTRQGGQQAVTGTDMIGNPNATSNNNEGSAASPTNDITGLWSGNGETIEFKSNGQCAYLGQVYPYKLSQGHVTLTAPEGEVMFQYSIKGDQLSLSFNNNTVTYSRGATATGTGQQQQTTGSGQVAMELVGKWCFVNVNSYNQGASSSSECITLNADGTYEFYGESSRSVNTPDFYGGTNSQNADRGTWNVQGDLIYYHSQTQGEGSYKLEKRNHPRNVNDPMIILDGRAYVTYYNKPPWR